MVEEWRVNEKKSEEWKEERGSRTSVEKKREKNLNFFF